MWQRKEQKNIIFENIRFYEFVGPFEKGKRGPNEPKVMILTCGLNVTKTLYFWKKIVFYEFGGLLNQHCYKVS